MLNFKFLIYLDGFILGMYYFLLREPFNPFKETELLPYLKYIVVSYTTILLFLYSLSSNKINSKFKKNRLLYILPIILFYIFNTAYLLLYSYSNQYQEIKEYLSFNDKVYFQFIIFLFTMKILAYISIFKNTK